MTDASDQHKSPIEPGDVKTGTPIRLTDLFRRDRCCWRDALTRGRWVILGGVLLGGMLGFTARHSGNLQSYTGRCAMIRQNSEEFRSQLPSSYAPVPNDVLFAMIRGTKCLRMLEAKLHLDPSRPVDRSISIRPDSTADGFQICATAETPARSAELANGMARIFLDEYKLLIRKNLESSFAGNSRAVTVLREELDSLRIRQGEIYIEALEQRLAALSEDSDAQEKLRQALASAELAVRSGGTLLVDLRPGWELLPVVPVRLKSLNDQLERKQELLGRKESEFEQLRFFFESPYSDIVIREEALPPVSPDDRRIAAFTALTALLGGFAAMVLLMMVELFTFSVRTRGDLEKSLHLPCLAEVPDFNAANRDDYYSSLQQLLSRIRRELPERRKPAFALLPAAPHRDAARDRMLRELIELMSLREDFTCKIILNADSGELAGKESLLLNDYLHGISEQLPESGADGVLYFNLNDLDFVSPPSHARLRKLAGELAGYDVVIWETFPAEKHWHLFSELADFADMLILPIHAGKTSKFELQETIGRFDRRQAAKLFGMLYQVHKSARKSTV